jgi:hypothetical protein
MVGPIEQADGLSAGQFGAQYVSEAIGRRYAMFVITTILLIVGGVTYQLG